jgi:hypothetical protein
MVSTFDVAKAYSELPALVLELETHGVESAVLREVTGESPAVEALRAIEDLGGKLVYRLTEAEGEGEIIIGDAAVAGSTGPDIVVEVAEHYSHLPDNSSKLESAEGDQRHLFIWVESSRHQTVAMIGEPFMPERSPNLPARVSAVWLVTAYRPAHIWQFHTELGWRDLGSWRPADESME